MPKNIYLLSSNYKKIKNLKGSRDQMDSLYSNKKKENKEEDLSTRSTKDSGKRSLINKS